MLLQKLKFIKNYLTNKYYLEKITPSQLKNVVLKGNNHVVNSTIGEHSYLALNTIVSHTEMGSFCSIGPNVVIGYGDHPTDYLSTSPRIFFRELFPDLKSNDHKKYYDSHKKVVIENDVWVGANCYIKNGIKISNGAIIAAGSVVTKDVLPYEIVGGVPAKHIRYRFNERVCKELLDLCWWDLSIDKIKKIEPYLSTEIDEKIISTIKHKLNGS